MTTSEDDGKHMNPAFKLKFALSGEISKMGFVKCGAILLTALGYMLWIFTLFKPDSITDKFVGTRDVHVVGHHEKYDECSWPPRPNFSSDSDVSKHLERPISRKPADEVQESTHEAMLTVTDRVKHVQAVCTRDAGINALCDHQWRFMLADENHRVLFGQVPKVGSTNWVCLLANMSGKITVDMDDQRQKVDLVTNRVKLSTLGLKYFPGLPSYQTSKYFSEYYKFTFVRHPFFRLVSAYRNKINPGQEWYRKHYGRAILRKYRPKATAYDIKSGRMNVTFEEFIKYIIYLSGFPGNVFDEHWAPYYRLLCPCLIHYDFVGKMENLQDDFRLLLRLGFNQTTDNDIAFPPETKEHVSGVTEHIVIEYFKTLSEQQTKDLIAIFALDFQLFNYSATPFIPYKL